MRLYLMRHGQAESPTIDPEQSLTENGKLAIEQIAAELARKSVKVSQIFHSTKKRAEQTANIVSKFVSSASPPQTMDNLKPGDNPAEILEVLNQQTGDTLIVSHLPFLPSLVDLLTNSHNAMHFEPGTVVCLRRSGSLWQLEWTTGQPR